VNTYFGYNTFGWVNATDTVANPFRFTGREWDSETNLYYYRARYYDPLWGRFLSEDPLEFYGDDLDFYAYVANDPANHVDPWGLCRILSNGNLISIETNNGSQRLGPFPASNKTVCNCGLDEGVYKFDKPQWLYKNGKETPLGASRFDAKRDRHQGFGTVRIPIEVVGRSGIMIHSRFPDTKELKPTEGCVRVHDAVVTAFARFIDTVCEQDEPNTFHFYKRPW
jgi:RHS repeat-associated protein